MPLAGPDTAAQNGKCVRARFRRAGSMTEEGGNDE